MERRFEVRKQEILNEARIKPAVSNKMIERLESVLKVLRCVSTGQSSAHQVDHSDEDHRLTILRQLLIVFAHTTITIQPRKSPLHNPSFRQHFKTCVGSFHDLKRPMKKHFDRLY